MKASKFALVTGANRGIGLETVTQLAKKNKKLHVFLGARNEHLGEQAIKELNKSGINNVSLIIIDLNNITTFSLAKQSMQLTISNKTGVKQQDAALDILVNNAGIQIESKKWQNNTTLDVELETLRQTFEVNFFGLVKLTNTLLPLLRKSKGGRIVNVSTMLSSLAFQSDTSTLKSNIPCIIQDIKVFGYDASKAALNTYTIHLARALKDTNIQVNSVSPGWVKTRLGTSDALMTVEEGAKVCVNLALVSDKEINGRFFQIPINELEIKQKPICINNHKHYELPW